MTGFGKVTAELPDKKVTVEIKSLNSKQLDLSVRIPAVYREREMQLRNELLQRLERGKVDLNINVEYIGRDTSARINAAAVTGYYEQIHELAGRLGVPEPTDWFATLLRLPETVRSEAGEVSEAEWQAVHGAVSEAITRLIDFRTQEGAMLRRVFEQKIGIIGDLLREVEPYEQERVEKIRSRLTENLKKISEVEYDRNRLEQELIYYLEKLDINAGEPPHLLPPHARQRARTGQEARLHRAGDWPRDQHARVEEQPRRDADHRGTHEGRAGADQGANSQRAVSNETG